MNPYPPGVIVSGRTADGRGTLGDADLAVKRQGPGHNADVIYAGRSAKSPPLDGYVFIHDLPGRQMEFSYDSLQLPEYRIIAVRKADNRLIDYGHVIKRGKVVQGTGPNIFLYGILKKPAGISLK